MTTADKHNQTQQKYADFWQADPNQKNASQDLPTAQDILVNAKNHQQDTVTWINHNNRRWADRSELIMHAQSEHYNQARQTLSDNTDTFNQHLHHLTKSMHKVDSPQALWRDWLSYATDASRRILQTADILRERGDIFLEHEQAGCPPVLDYDYEVVLDGSILSRPSNYVLLKILPPKGITTRENGRPYVIIDPRAGHGAGIGGFKHDSQVGVALSEGHPVYFVAFKRLPEPNQSIADVIFAEAAFVREVRRRHPKSNAPVVVGNCQGGWAALILAATNPDITGPIVMNGSPVSAWSGEVGINPMRYKAGIQGGTWLAMLTSDLGNGIFDGAWLVHNFEQLNPSRNYVGKYYDLYKNPTKNRERFLNFERWWGGFFLMNDAEIQWIVENIFVGNRIARNTAQIEKGTNIDLRNIKAPIIIFASHGDNITPPPQAINWILDTYSDEREIEVCGQRIVYMVHDKVGHLGIFVSSSIANREHKGMASILKMIEALSPGLYELVIEDYQGKGEDMQFYVTFKSRTFDDLALIDDGRLDEKPFQAVHRYSKAQARSYELYLRPWMQTITTETSAEWFRTMHPLRLQRRLWSSKNPMAMMVKTAADSINTNKLKNINPNQHLDHDDTNPEHKEADVKQQQAILQGTVASPILPAIEALQQDNLFLQIERLWMDTINTTLDLWRDWQAMTTEMMFYGWWTLPWLRTYGQQETSRRLTDKERLQDMPSVQTALSHIEQGGFREAVVRMLILSNMMSQSGIKRDKLMLITEILTQSKPFTELSHDQLAELLHKQTIIVRFAKQNAIQSLSKLLKTKADKQKAIDVVRYVTGSYHKMPLDTRQALSELYEAMGLDSFDKDVDNNPLEVTDVVVG